MPLSCQAARAESWSSHLPVSSAAHGTDHPLGSLFLSALGFLPSVGTMDRGHWMVGGLQVAACQTACLHWADRGAGSRPSGDLSCACH